MVLETGFLSKVYFQAVYSFFFVPLLTLNSNAPSPCLCSSRYSVVLESNCSSFSLMISGLNWERFPKVWLVLRGDVETGSSQNHAAAETGKLHSNALLPRLICSAFSWKYGSLISGSHISPNIFTWSHTQSHVLWWIKVCIIWTFLHSAQPIWISLVAVQQERTLGNFFCNALVFKLSRVFYISS